jgi:hypothetical protein
MTTGAETPTAEPGLGEPYGELVMAIGSETGEDSITFNLVFGGDGDPFYGQQGCEATLTMNRPAWLALGSPETVHVYNAFPQEGDGGGRHVYLAAGEDLHVHYQAGA